MMSKFIPLTIDVNVIDKKYIMICLNVSCYRNKKTTNATNVHT